MIERKGGPRCAVCGGLGREKSIGDPDALGKLERVTIGRLAVRVHGDCKPAAVKAEIEKWHGGKAAAGAVHG